MTSSLPWHQWRWTHHIEPKIVATCSWCDEFTGPLKFFVKYSEKVTNVMMVSVEVEWETTHVLLIGTFDLRWHIFPRDISNTVNDTMLVPKEVMAIDWHHIYLEFVHKVSIAGIHSVQTFRWLDLQHWADRCSIDCISGICKKIICVHRVFADCVLHASSEPGLFMFVSVDSHSESPDFDRLSCSCWKWLLHTSVCIKLSCQTWCVCWLLSVTVIFQSVQMIWKQR